MPEHDAQSCWTEFSPLLSSLSSVLGAVLRSSDPARVEAPRIFPPPPVTLAHKSRLSKLVGDCAEIKETASPQMREREFAKIWPRGAGDTLLP